jgi:hypothetical protein
VSDSARGSLVLGTNSALLMGHLNTARLERSVSFKMDQVQAHVVCSEMDTQRGPLWLQIANGKLSTPPGAEGIMRQVLLPFKVRGAVGACGVLRCAVMSFLLCWAALKVTRPVHGVGLSSRLY